LLELSVWRGLSSEAGWIRVGDNHVRDPLVVIGGKHCMLHAVKSLTGFGRKLVSMQQVGM
jgi:hypothetical protein